MIYVECKADKVLIRSLGVSEKYVKHAGGPRGIGGGIGTVCRKLENINNSKGMIDEDPKGTRPRYIEKLKIDRKFLKHKIMVRRDNQRNNYLFILCPKLEDWILEAAKEVDIDVKSYDLSDDADKLHKTINVHLGKFEELISDLRKKSKMLKSLEKLIGEEQRLTLFDNL